MSIESAMMSPTAGMSNPVGSGWSQLRQQARTFEGQVDTLFSECLMPSPNDEFSQTESYFHKYSQFATATTIPPKATEDERQTEASIQDLLEKVRRSYFLVGIL